MRRFECTDVKEKLVPFELGSRKVRVQDLDKEMMFPARFYCLICGEKVAEWEPEYIGKRAFVYEDVVLCRHSKDADRPCEFGVHKNCALMHDKWLDGNKKFDESMFECESVKYNMDKTTVEHLSQKRLPGRKKKIENLKKNNVIKHSDNKRKRRYTNPNNFCRYCSQEIPREQKHHLMLHCTGLATTPVLRSRVTDLRATARRCLEMVCADESKSNPVAVRKRKSGEFDGESLAEMTPKRKRNRKNIKTTINISNGHAARPPDPGGTG